MQWQAAGLILYFGFFDHLTAWSRPGVGALVLAPVITGIIFRAGAPREGENPLGRWGERFIRWVLVPLWLFQFSQDVISLSANLTSLVAQPDERFSGISPDSRRANYWPWLIFFVLAAIRPVRGPQWIAKASVAILLAAPFAYRAELPNVAALLAQRQVLENLIRLIGSILLWFLPIVYLGGRASSSTGWMMAACFSAFLTTELALAAGAVHPKMGSYVGAVIAGTEQVRTGKTILLLLTSIATIRCLGTWTGDCFGPYRRWYLIALIAVGMVFLPHPLNDSYMFPTAAAFPSLFGALAAARWRRVVSAPLRVGLSWLIGLTVTILSYAMHGKDPAPLLSFAAAFAAGAVLHFRRERPAEETQL